MDNSISFIIKLTFIVFILFQLRFRQSAYYVEEFTIMKKAYGIMNKTPVAEIITHPQLVIISKKENNRSLKI